MFSGYVFDHGPGQRETVVGRGAASDFIENDEAARGSRVEDHRGFGHLDHERRAAAREIVRSADAREDAVDQRQENGIRGHPRTHLRHDCDQRRLAEIGAFAAHVRAGDDGDLVVGVIEIEIVGDETAGFFARELFDDRMAARLYAHFAGFLAFDAETRPSVAVLGGNLRQRGRHIEFGHGCCGGANPLRMIGGLLADFAEDALLDLQNFFVGGQHLALVFLELGRGESLSVDQRLFAFVIGGRRDAGSPSKSRCNSRTHY